MLREINSTYISEEIQGLGGCVGVRGGHNFWLRQLTFTSTTANFDIDASDIYINIHERVTMHDTYQLFHD